MGITASSLNLTDFDIEREHLRSRRFLFLLSRVQTSLRALGLLLRASSRLSLSLLFLSQFVLYRIAGSLVRLQTRRANEATTTSSSSRRRRRTNIFSLSLPLLHKRARAQRFLRIVPTSSRPPRFKRYTKDSNNSIKSTKDTSARTSC